MKHTGSLANAFVQCRVPGDELWTSYGGRGRKKRADLLILLKMKQTALIYQRIGYLFGNDANIRFACFQGTEGDAASFVLVKRVPTAKRLPDPPLLLKAG